MDERWFLFLGLFVLALVYADGAACGNDVIEGGEVCDLNKLNSQNCTKFNYTGGSLSCLEDCSGYDYSQCTGEEVCGNGIISGGEVCEPENVRGRTCENEGYDGGTLKCKSDCVKYDYKECTGVKSVCGDNNITGKEECESLSLNNKSCSDLDFDFGVLRCNANCTFNYEYCFIEEINNETLNENVSESLNQEVNNTSLNYNITQEVENVSSYKLFSLGNAVIYFSILAVIGTLIIYFYVFKK